MWDTGGTHAVRSTHGKPLMLNGTPGGGISAIEGITGWKKGAGAIVDAVRWCSCFNMRSVWGVDSTTGRANGVGAYLLPSSWLFAIMIKSFVVSNR